jgi:hypothetical protein
LAEPGIVTDPVTQLAHLDGLNLSTLDAGKDRSTAPRGDKFAAPRSSPLHAGTVTKRCHASR